MVKLCFRPLAHRAPPPYDARSGAPDMSPSVRAGLAVGLTIALAMPAWPLAQRATAPPPPATQAPSPRPNIVLIFPDNLGWGEVGVYGSVRGVPTPRLDRLAAQGM